MVASPFKFELKYFISTFDHLSLTRRLGTMMRPDPNGGSGGAYRVRSLYFDDLENHGLYEKLSGVQMRSKFRIRIYNGNPETAKLEKKSKAGQLSRKQYCRISAEEIEKIRAGDLSFIQGTTEPLLLDFYRHCVTGRLKPMVVVDYHRDAFVLPEQDVRVTFDRRLSSGLASSDLLRTDLPLVPMLENGMGILEVKFVTHLPDHLRSAIQLSSRTRSSICKYAICRKHTKTNSWEDN
jgi:hypothetical protein